MAREQRSLESRKAHIDETLREEMVEQPRGQREAGRRAAGKVAEAPTKPQGTEKTTIHNQAAGRGESQEDQPTPRTKPEEQTGRAPRENQKSWTPPGRRKRANRKITSQELRDTNRYATRWRGTTRATMAAKTDTGANKEQPQGREGWSKKSRESERDLGRGE